MAGLESKNTEWLLHDSECCTVPPVLTFPSMLVHCRYAIVAGPA
jgi:hypothetical protein